MAFRRRRGRGRKVRLGGRRIRRRLRKRRMRSKRAPRLRSSIGFRM